MLVTKNKLKKNTINKARMQQKRLSYKMILLLIVTAIIGVNYAQKKDAWQNLFDGKSLNGWEVKQGNAKLTIENGMLVGTTFPGNTKTFIGTKKEYGNFILDVDFK